MRVLKYYVKDKALFETWKDSKRQLSIIILCGIKIYVKHNRKQWKSCSPLCQTYKPTLISKLYSSNCMSQACTFSPDSRFNEEYFSTKMSGICLITTPYISQQLVYRVEYNDGWFGKLETGRVRSKILFRQKRQWLRNIEMLKWRKLTTYGEW